MQVCGMEEPLGWGKVPEELRFSKPGTSWALLSPCRENGLASMVLNSSTGSLPYSVCHQAQAAANPTVPRAQSRSVLGHGGKVR
jgi:hypothetical protein